MLNFDFQKRIWDQFFHHILCMVFQEKCFSFYILLTDQISLSDYLSFLRYWAKCVLQLFVNQVVTSLILKLTVVFLSSCFPTCEEKSRQKLKYLNNRTSFSDEINEPWRYEVLRWVIMLLVLITPVLNDVIFCDMVLKGRVSSIYGSLTVNICKITSIRVNVN